jgi:Flp pilus assembly pilin Flp
MAGQRFSKRIGAAAKRFQRDETGAVAVEYGILLLMLSIALVGILTLDGVSGKLRDTFTTISGQLR